MVGGRLGRATRELGPSRQQLEARHIGLTRGPRNLLAAPGGQTWTLETHPGRSLRFADLGDGAVDHDLTWPSHKRPDQDEGHDDRHDEGYHAQGQLAPIPGSEHSLYVDERTAEDGAGISRRATRGAMHELEREIEDPGEDRADPDEGCRGDDEDAAATVLGDAPNGSAQREAEDHRKGQRDDQEPDDDTDEDTVQMRRSAPRTPAPRRSASRARPMLNKACRDERHGRRGRRVDDPRGAGPARSRQEHPETSDARQPGPERDLGDPLVVKVASVWAVPRRKASPREDPAGCMAKAMAGSSRT